MPLPHRLTPREQAEVMPAALAARANAAARALRDRSAIHLVLGKALVSFPESAAAPAGRPMKARKARPGEPCCAVAVVRDGSGNVLTVRQPDGGLALPGGWLLDGEDPALGAARECREETGFPASPVRVLLVQEDEDGNLAAAVECQLHGVQGVPDRGEVGHVSWLPEADLLRESPYANFNAAALAVLARLEDPAEAELAGGPPPGLLRKEQERDDHGRFGAGSGAPAVKPSRQTAARAAAGLPAVEGRPGSKLGDVPHPDVVRWARNRSEVMGKPVYMVPNGTDHPSLSYKPPAKGGYSVFHPGRDVLHVHKAAGPLDGEALNDAGRLVPDQRGVRPRRGGDTSRTTHDMDVARGYEAAAGGEPSSLNDILGRVSKADWEEDAHPRGEGGKFGAGGGGGGSKKPPSGGTKPEKTPKPDGTKPEKTPAGGPEGGERKPTVDKVNPVEVAAWRAAGGAAKLSAGIKGLFGKAVEKIKGAPAALKGVVVHELHLAKDAGAGIKNAVTGKEVTPGQKAAMRTVALKVAIKLAFTAIGAALPGVGHAVGALIEHAVPHFAEAVAHHVAHHAAEHAIEHIVKHQAAARIGLTFKAAGAAPAEEGQDVDNASMALFANAVLAGVQDALESMTDKDWDHLTSGEADTSAAKDAGVGAFEAGEGGLEGEPEQEGDIETNEPLEKGLKEHHREILRAVKEEQLRAAPTNTQEGRKVQRLIDSGHLSAGRRDFIAGETPRGGTAYRPGFHINQRLTVTPKGEDVLRDDHGRFAAKSATPQVPGPDRRVGGAAPGAGYTVREDTPVGYRIAKGEDRVHRKTEYRGIPIHIDRPVGFVQTGKDAEGKPWKRVYKIDYGFIPGTKGGDGEGLDVFLASKPTRKDGDHVPVHWAVQVDKDGQFDEYKVLFGFEDPEEARKAYEAHIPPQFLKAMKTTSVGMVRALLGLEPIEVVKALLADTWEDLLAATEQVAGLEATAKASVTVGEHTRSSGEKVEEHSRRAPLSDEPKPSEPKEDEPKPSEPKAPPEETPREGGGGGSGANVLRELAGVRDAGSALQAVGNVVGGLLQGRVDAARVKAAASSAAAARASESQATRSQERAGRENAEWEKDQHLKAAHEAAETHGKAAADHYDAARLAESAGDKEAMERHEEAAADHAKSSNRIAAAVAGARKGKGDMDEVHAAVREGGAVAEKHGKPPPGVEHEPGSVGSEGGGAAGDQPRDDDGKFAAKARLSDLSRDSMTRPYVPVTPAAEGDGHPDGEDPAWARKWVGKKHEVALVRKAADDAPAGEERYILGVVLEPDTVDLQGDIYSRAEIRKTAHRWMADFRNIDLQHKVLINHLVTPVESYLAPADMVVGGRAIKEGSWLLAAHVPDDDVWNQIKAGKITGWSISGLARRTPVREF